MAQLLSPDRPCPAFARISRSAEVFDSLSRDSGGVQLACWTPDFSPAARFYLSQLSDQLYSNLSQSRQRREHLVRGRKFFWLTDPADHFSAKQKVKKFWQERFLPAGRGRSEIVAALAIAQNKLQMISDGIGYPEGRSKKNGAVYKGIKTNLAHYDSGNAWTMFAALSGVGTIVYDTEKLRRRGRWKNKRELEQRSGRAARIYGAQAIPSRAMLAPVAYQLPSWSISIWRGGQIDNPLLHDFPPMPKKHERACILLSGYVLSAG